MVEVYNPDNQDSPGHLAKSYDEDDDDDDDDDDDVEFICQHDVSVANGNLIFGDEMEI